MVRATSALGTKYRDLLGLQNSRSSPDVVIFTRHSWQAESEIKRRDFLRRGLQASLLATPLRQTWAGETGGAHQDRRRLILVELRGGNDGLNTVVPFTEPAYYALRPGLALHRDTVLHLDSQAGLHPALQPLMPAWQAGELAVLQGMGSPDRNLSHFRARELWKTGFLQYVAGASAVSYQDFDTGIASLCAASFPLATAHDSQPLVHLALDGFDTHENQSLTHAMLLSRLALGLANLRRSMVDKNLWHTTLILTFSEFARRPRENANAGTDHGGAGVQFALGGQVRGGLYGHQPDLRRLDAVGNPECIIDISAVYAEVGSAWCKPLMPSSAAPPAARLRFLRT